MASRADVLLATSAEYPDLPPDDGHLVAALRARGVGVRPRVWTDGDVEADEGALLVVRGTWDYTSKLDAFLAWLSRAGDAVETWNPVPLLRWNAVKTYLRELEARGVPIVPTVWLARGERADLSGILRREGWSRAVVKPVVGVAARGSAVVDAARLDGAQAHLDRMLPDVGMMVQPYLSRVESQGEASLVHFDGAFSHAVLKRPARGDYRIQEIYGGTTARFDPDAEARDVARRTLAACGHPTLYARVDLVRDDAGAWRLMELEALEPNLFLGHDPAAAGRLADAIAKRLP